MSEPSLFISKHGSQVFLSGMSPDPYPLWDLNQRLDHAKRNAHEASKHQGKLFPVFLGIEHLPHVQGLTDYLIIEKSRHYAEFFLSEFPDVAIDSTKTVVGDVGLYAPQTLAVFRAVFYRQEIGKMLFKLWQQPHTDFLHAVVFELPLHSTETLYHEQLKAGLYLVQQAQLFHQQHQHHYTAYQKGGANQTNIFLCSDAVHEAQKLKTDFAFLDQGRGLEFFNFPHRFSEAAHDLLLPLDVNQAKDNAEVFRETVERCRPEFCAQINRGGFFNLADTLFAEVMLHHMQIPVYSFFSDWFTVQSNRFRGGWKHDVYTELMEPAFNKTFSMYPYHAGLARPGKDTYYYPYRFVRPKSDHASPVASPDDIERDLAIIHITRIYAVEWKELNELYELITRHSQRDPGKTILCFLHVFRQHLKKQVDPLLTSAYVQNIVNYLEWIDYNQIRTRFVMAVVNQCQHQGDIKVTVYGKNWNKLVTENVCGGELNKEELAHVYRTSYATIDCSPMYSIHTPHFSAVDCLTHGGLPFLNAPVLDESHDQSFVALDLKRFLYYHGVEDLFKLYQKFKNDWSLRQNYIQEAQASWLVEQNQPKGFDEWLQQPLPPFGEVPQGFTHDEGLDQTLLTAATGYIYKCCGCQQLAKTLWLQALRDGFDDEVLQQLVE